MADHILEIQNEAKRDAKSFLIITAVSDSSIPSGEYITLNAVLKDKSGNTICKRAIVDGEGNEVQITATSQMTILDYNFLDIEPVYHGDNMPSDLKVYEF